jgi:hypothetical protein
MSSIPQQKHIVLEYSPGDFFYVSQKSIMPSNEMCQNYLDASIDCTKTATTGDNYTACLKQALCQNKSLVEQVYNKQNVHSGEDVKWRDLNLQYSAEMLKTFNLLMGIILSGIFIYYNRPSST